MNITTKGREMFASPGFDTMACLTLGLHGNPGDSVPAFPTGKAREVCRTIEERGRQTRCRESDGLVVLKREGNAARGKETTHVSVV